MPDTGDARLIAYGKLIDALPGLLDAEGRQALCDWLAERQVLHDGQEDPGAVMVEGLEVELAIAQVFRELAERFECGQP
ncbi:hypothetical protein [Paracoccus sp. SSK6]|uniref:hypothetical protein n=1 Tax=Paracoccus sp. SSK6 TaxID=3143131 RepID=UPI00321B9D68